MSFESELRAFEEKVAERGRGVFLESVNIVRESIVDGSEVTGAPGQPVDTGALRASWQQVFESEDVAAVITAQDYAPPIEEGVGRFGPMQLRSKVGGFHSVKMTRASWQRILDEAVLRNVRGGT